VTLLDGYYEAFSRFMRGQAPDALAAYCDPGAELAILDVYRNGFLKSCADVLRSNYPSVDNLVGEACFKMLARRHVEAHPPRKASLVTYGDGFAQTIAQTRALHRLAYLSSIARLDRAWTEVYFAVDGAAPDVDVLAGLRPDALVALRGRLAPWARVVRIEYGVLAAWSRLRQDGIREHMEIQRAPVDVLIWRSGDDVAFRALSGAECAFVEGIGAGFTCAEAAMAAVGVDADFDLAGAFATLLHQRILILDWAHPPRGSR
jgi:hypothetical protein